jgi:hypothetical protein
MFINWDVTARFDPNSLVDSTQGISMHGIPIPSYGNYGGPNYTAGVEGGTTPGGPNPIPAPRDDLDKLFWQHDLAYQQVKDGLVPPNDIPDAVAKADVTLVEGLYDLITKTNLAPEAFLYDALATLTIGAKILTTPSELAYLKANPMDAGVVLPAIQAAIPNFETGLAETPGEARSLNGAFHVFEARFAQQLTQAMASFGSPSIPESSNIGPHVSDTSQQPLLTIPQHA